MSGKRTELVQAWVDEAQMKQIKEYARATEANTGMAVANANAVRALLQIGYEAWKAKQPRSRVR